LLLAATGPAVARVYRTQEQALAAAFPAPQRVERRTLYLDAGQARRTAEAAGVPVEGRVVPYYAGTIEGRVTGYAYFDSHLVRTLPETVMILIEPGGRIGRIEVLSFDEPEDYLPGEHFYRQFSGRGPDDDLSPGRGLRTITGATLSARAASQAARRILALHRLWVEPPPAGRETTP
jgi:hypothetical protein